MRLKAATAPLINHHRKQTTNGMVRVLCFMDTMPALRRRIEAAWPLVTSKWSTIVLATSREDALWNFCRTLTMSDEDTFAGWVGQWADFFEKG